MSVPQRRRSAGVIERLLAEPHRFGFFQAVRLLRRWLGEEGPAVQAAASSRLRFRNTLSLAFPASEVAGLEVLRSAEGAAGEDASRPAAAITALPATDAVARVEVTPAFFGLLGVGGALPLHYGELLAERERSQGDLAARAFLDIFQDRAVGLFYEAWRKHRLAVRQEPECDDRLLPLLSVAGLGQQALRNRLRAGEGGVADETLACFSGLLQQRPVSAVAVRQAVSDYFEVPVETEQFVGRWFTLPMSAATSLGAACAVLGGGAVVGERVWQRDLRMRLTLGPLTRQNFDRFLPGGSAAVALRELLTLFTGVSLEYEVRLSLRADEVVGVRLADGAAGARLGWDSFLVTRPVTADRRDVGYDIHALA